ncbi:MAG: PP2C family protein-serine/threonine phosphatase [Acidimicrobiia bacterium]
MLLVEDDPGDAFLVEELLDESDLVVAVEWVRTVAEAVPLVTRADCVLLDLGLPDSFGLDGLQAMLAADRTAAVIVLTGLSHRGRGVEAVASGAQDYLIKAEIDALLLGRSMRYAIERRRADDATRRLFAADFSQAVNERIQRGLLPRPLLSDPTLSFANLYRPGGGEDVLGGDFYDAVELDDGTLRAVVGDVSGHGPDEAALGVSLRIAWRTLVLARTPEDLVLPALDDVLVAERQHDEAFVTVCDMTVSPERTRASVRLAGHPPPVLLGGEPMLWPAVNPGPILGVVPAAVWEPATVDLPERWAVLLYTDGLVEGRHGGGSERVGLDGLIGYLTEMGVGRGGDKLGEEVLVDLVAWAEGEHQGPLPDDVALFLLSGGA